MPHRRLAALAGAVLLSSGCTLDRTVELGRDAGARAGLLPSWQVERASTWRLPGDAPILVVADTHCMQDGCRRAAALGRPTAFNEAARDLLAERLVGAFPRTESLEAATAYDEALSLSRRRGIRFLLHVQATRLEPGGPFDAASGELRLLLVDTRAATVVDRAFVRARADLLGRTSSARDVLRQPLADYVDRLSGG